MSGCWLAGLLVSMGWKNGINVEDDELGGGFGRDDVWMEGERSFFFIQEVKYGFVQCVEAI